MQCVLVVVTIAAGFLAIFVFQAKSKKAYTTALEFHDYLINYRLTPRSRIMRKHLPKMSMVVEEESQYEGSVMGQSVMVASMSNLS